jgi:hypothetical protein
VEEWKSRVEKWKSGMEEWKSRVEVWGPAVNGELEEWLESTLIPRYKFQLPFHFILSCVSSSADVTLPSSQELYGC